MRAMTNMRCALACWPFVCALLYTWPSCRVDGDRIVDPSLDCVDGECSCTPGLGDCDGIAETGCETDLSSASSHCGACFVACANASCIDAACVCDPGFGDCDADARNGCETPLVADASHCGRCGRDCLGGACVDARCEPVELSVAVNLDFAEGLIHVDGRLFWTDASAVWSRPVLPSATEMLITGEDCPAYLAHDDGWLYWQIETGVRAMPQGGAAIDLATWPNTSPFLTCSPPPGRALVAAAGHVYWLHEGAMVHKAPSGTPQPVATSALVKELETNDTHVFWGESSDNLVGSLMRRAHSGSAGELVAGQLNIDYHMELALDAGDLYWVEGDAVNGAKIVRKVAGGVQGELVANTGKEGWPYEMVVDATGIYAADSLLGVVIRWDLADGHKEIIATGQAWPRSVVLDGTYAYWLTNRAIMRVPK